MIHLAGHLDSFHDLILPKEHTRPFVSFVDDGLINDCHGGRLVNVCQVLLVEAQCQLHSMFHPDMVIVVYQRRTNSITVRAFQVLEVLEMEGFQMTDYGVTRAGIKLALETLDFVLCDCHTFCHLSMPVEYLR